MKKISLWIITCLLIIGLSSCNSEKKKRAIEYLSQFERNENINHVDDLYIYTKGKLISIYEEELLEDSDILFVSKSSIYFSVRVEKNHYEVYKTDHDCSYSEKTFETDNLRIYRMINEDIIICEKDAIYYKCSIKNNTCEEFDKNDIQSLRSSRYSYEIKEHKPHFFKKIKDFCITDNDSQETRIFNEENMGDLLKVEQASYLNDLVGLEINGVILLNDKIYIRCISGNYPHFIITIYLYDFESETFTFMDWTEIRELEGFSTFIS